MIRTRPSRSRVLGVSGRSNRAVHRAAAEEDPRELQVVVDRGPEALKLVRVIHALSEGLTPELVPDQVILAAFRALGPRR